MTDQLRAALGRFVAEQMPDATNVEVVDVEPINSVGNARQPWRFDVVYTRDGCTETIGCVMLVKAGAGQLETPLPREFHTVRSLHGRGVPIARALWLDETGDAIGSPFFVTERMPGTADMALMRRDANDTEARSVALDLARAAARLHQVDWQAGGFDFLDVVHPAKAAGAQIDYWFEVFDRQRMEPLPAVVFAFDWLRDHQPAAEAVSIVHGDFRFGNILYEDGRITALLDWEMVHLGDPIEDLAWCYRSLWSLEKFLSADEFLSQYGELAGRPVDRDHFHYYRLFSEVKHSIISLTAARSFNDRRTDNIRLADRATTVTPFLNRFMEWIPS